MKHFKRILLIIASLFYGSECISGELYDGDCKSVPMVLALTNASVLQGQLVAIGGVLSFQSGTFAIPLLFLDQSSFDGLNGMNAVELGLETNSKGLDAANGKYATVCGFMSCVKENNLYKIPRLTDIRYVKVGELMWRKGKWD